jgi:hypothetical protein
VSVAVRLADAMGLRGGQDSHKLSVLDQELRRRLWFGIGVLDLQSALDRGSQVLLGSSEFSDWPINSDDKDITAHSISQPVREDRLTEMSFAHMTFHAAICHRKLTELGISGSNDDANAQVARQQQLAALADFELVVKRLGDQHGTSPTQIEAFTMNVAQGSLVAMRLLFHRPLHKRGKNREMYQHGQLSNDELLIMATEVLESSRSKRLSGQFAQWAWFKWVKWFALAVVLAELCTARGSSADRAWIVAQQSFDDYATIVADTESGMLWRPIAKLMQRARSIREGQKAMSKTIRPTTNDSPTDIQWRGYSLEDHSQMKLPLDDQLRTTSRETVFNADTDVDMTWFHWDLLIEDIETGNLDLDTEYFPVG